MNEKRNGVHCTSFHIWSKYVPEDPGLGVGDEIISMHIVLQIRGDENFPTGGSFYNLIMSNKAKDCFLFMFQLMKRREERN